MANALKCFAQQVFTDRWIPGATGSICWFARGVKGQVGGSIPTGNNPPSMNGRRRVRGWGASGCSNLTCSGRGTPGMLQLVLNFKLR